MMHQYSKEAVSVKLTTRQSQKFVLNIMSHNKSANQYKVVCLYFIFFFMTETIVSLFTYDYEYNL